MNNFKSIKITKPAEIDLKNIASYTIENWGKSQQNKYLSRFKQLFLNLSHSDEDVLALMKVRVDIEPGIFSYHVEKHVVFFRLTQQEVFILRVLHASMDVERHLIK